MKSWFIQLKDFEKTIHDTAVVKKWMKIQDNIHIYMSRICKNEIRSSKLWYSFFFRLLDNSIPDLHDKSWYYFFFPRSKKKVFIQKLNYYFTIIAQTFFFVKIKIHLNHVLNLKKKNMTFTTILIGMNMLFEIIIETETRWIIAQSDFFF